MPQMSADFAEGTEREPVSAAKERKERMEEGRRACQSAGGFGDSRQGAKEAWAAFSLTGFPVFDRLLP